MGCPKLHEGWVFLRGGEKNRSRSAPAEMDGGWNLYAIVGNDPVGRWDIRGNNGNEVTCIRKSQTISAWKIFNVYVGKKDLGTSGTTGNPGARNARCVFIRLVTISWQCPCSCFKKGASGFRIVKKKQPEYLNRTAAGPFLTVAVVLQVPIPRVPRFGVGIELLRKFTKGGLKSAIIACRKIKPPASAKGLVRPHTCTVL